MFEQSKQAGKNMLPVKVKHTTEKVKLWVIVNVLQLMYLSSV